MYTIIFKHTGELPKELKNIKFYTRENAENYINTVIKLFDNILQGEIVRITDSICDNPEKLEYIKQIFDVYKYHPPKVAKELPETWRNHEFDRLYSLPLTELINYKRKLCDVVEC